MNTILIFIKKYLSDNCFLYLCSLNPIKLLYMKRILFVLFLFCAFSGFAQEFLLKSEWEQGYPYNMLCPRDPFNGYAYTVGYSEGTITVTDLDQGIYILQIKGDNSLETAKFVVK